MDKQTIKNIKKEIKIIKGEIKQVIKTHGKNKTILLEMYKDILENHLLKSE